MASMMPGGARDGAADGVADGAARNAVPCLLGWPPGRRLFGQNVQFPCDIHQFSLYSGDSRRR